jgi:hypothetical protein
MNRPSTVLGLLLCGSVLLLVTVHAGIKVKTDHDKAFDFKKPQTWAWNDTGAGQVLMARTADDRPDEVRERAEPVIKDAVATQLARRKLQPAVNGAPDLEVTYYLLITVGNSAQYVGQFAPAVAQWGLPPFSGATQALRTFDQGSLVLDISANDRMVWRGAAQAEIKLGLTVEKRHQLIRDAVRELLDRYPPRK